MYEIASQLSTQVAKVVDRLNAALCDEHLSHDELNIIVREAVIALAVISDVLNACGFDNDEL